MRNIYKASLFLGISIAVASCVPAKVHEELQAKYDKCSSEVSDAKKAAADAENKLADVETELSELKKAHAKIKEDTTIMGSSYRIMTSRYNDMERLNKEIQEKLRLLQNSAENENAKLNDELSKKELELQRKELELMKLESSLTKLQVSLEQKEKDLEAKQKRIDELEELLRQKDEKVKALKDKVYNALLAFKDKGLTVTEKDGKVYVSMEAKLLFASGSTKVGAEGIKALVELAKVLENQSDMEVIVEGHTDTDKMSSSSHPKNNWELSVLRATSVVQILLDNSSIDPKILTASGRSEYHPVSDDKAKNRRIEIILAPNLDELFKILNENE